MDDNEPYSNLDSVSRVYCSLHDGMMKMYYDGNYRGMYDLAAKLLAVSVSRIASLGAVINVYLESGSSCADSRTLLDDALSQNQQPTRRSAS